MRIHVKVIPNSRTSSIKEGEIFTVRIKEKPEDGKANLALLKLLKKCFKAKNVKIVSGFSSRNKTIEID